MESFGKKDIKQMYNFIFQEYMVFMKLVLILKKSIS